MTIKSKRLTIRPLTKADNQFLLELLNSKGWLDNIGDREVRTTIQAEKYISVILKKDSLQYMVIEKLDTSIPIGILSFMKRDQIEYPDFGFALLPSYHRQGYALEASLRYLHHLFSNDSKLTIAAICKKENTPSIHLLEKIGFTFNDILMKDKEPLNLYLLQKEDLIQK